MKLYDKDPIFSHFLKIFTTTTIFFPQDMVSLFDMIKYNEIISIMSQIICICDFVNFFHRIIWTFQELWIFIFLRESDIVTDVVCVFSTQENPPWNISHFQVMECHFVSWASRLCAISPIPCSLTKKGSLE